MMSCTEFTREGLTSLLHESELIVTFTKNDGTERLMHCTLQEHLLPVKPALKEGEEPKVKKVNEAVLPVYDLEAKAFRSFRVDSIKKVVRK